MDSPSGAVDVCHESVRRDDWASRCELLFVFEDLDWGLKAKPLGLGYAATSIVAHARGTTYRIGCKGRSTLRGCQSIYIIATPSILSGDIFPGPFPYASLRPCSTHFAFCCAVNRKALLP